MPGNRRSESGCRGGSFAPESAFFFDDSIDFLCDLGLFFRIALPEGKFTKLLKLLGQFGLSLLTHLRTKRNEAHFAASHHAPVCDTDHMRFGSGFRLRAPASLTPARTAQLAEKKFSLYTERFPALRTRSLRLATAERGGVEDSWVGLRTLFLSS